MIYLSESLGERYIPDHIRIDRIRPPKRGPGSRPGKEFEKEMEEIRALERAGVIVCDAAILADERYQERRKINKRKARARAKAKKAQGAAA